MSEMKRAIKWAQDLVKDTDKYLPNCSEALKRELLEQKVFAETAITAMQEKLEREKGCKNCEEIECSDGVIMPLDNVHAFYCNPDGTHIEIAFEFCPMCGKQLKGCGGNG